MSLEQPAPQMKWKMKPTDAESRGQFTFTALGMLSASLEGVLECLLVILSEESLCNLQLVRCSAKVQCG